MTKEERLRFHEMQAYWWTNSATNGHAASRRITRGDGHVLTDDELRDDAMLTAQSHMRSFMEVAENWEVLG